MAHEGLLAGGFFCGGAGELLVDRSLTCCNAQAGGDVDRIVGDRPRIPADGAVGGGEMGGRWRC